MPSANAPTLKVGFLAEAVKRINAKTPLGTALRSKALESLPLALREAAQFSARVESARILSQIQRSLEKELGQISDGGLVMSRERFVAKLLDVAKEELGDAPRKGGLQDIRSVGRVKLIHDMQTQQAYGKAAWAVDTDPENLNAAPAQEFKRLEARKKPRDDWERRWREAGGSFFGGRMIALKTDPVWMKLSRFGTPWPPYDYGSGMGVVDIYRDEAEVIGLVQPGQRLEATQEADFNAALEMDAGSITPELREMLQKVGVKIEAEKAKPVDKPNKNKTVEKTETYEQKEFKTKNEAEIVGLMLIKQSERKYQVKINSDGTNGPPLQRFNHGRSKTVESLSGKYSLGNVDAKTASVITNTLAEIQAENDRIGIPRLRGVHTSRRGKASMGDGILSINPEILSAEPIPWLKKDDLTAKPFTVSSSFTGPESIKATMWHEHGHHIHQQIGVTDAVSYYDPPMEKRLRAAFKRAHGGKDSATKYARENYKEWFAENYALVKMGRKDMVDKSEDLRKILEEIGVM